MGSNHPWPNSSAAQPTHWLVQVKICEVGGKGILLPLFGEAEQARTEFSTTRGGWLGGLERWVEPGDSLGNNGKLTRKISKVWIDGDVVF